MSSCAQWDKRDPDLPMLYLALHFVLFSISKTLKGIKTEKLNWMNHAGEDQSNVHGFTDQHWNKTIKL